MVHQSKLVGGLSLHRGKDCGEPNTKTGLQEWVGGRQALDEMFCMVVRNGIENVEASLEPSALHLHSFKFHSKTWAIWPAQGSLLIKVA